MDDNIEDLLERVRNTIAKSRHMQQRVTKKASDEQKNKLNAIAFNLDELETLIIKADNLNDEIAKQIEAL